MLSLLIGPLRAPRAFSRRPLSVDRRPLVMTYKANTRTGAATEEEPANATEARNGIFSNRSVPDQRCGAQVSLSARLLRFRRLRRFPVAVEKGGNFQNERFLSSQWFPDTLSEFAVVP